MARSKSRPRWGSRNLNIPLQEGSPLPPPSNPAGCPGCSTRISHRFLSKCLQIFGHFSPSHRRAFLMVSVRFYLPLYQPCPHLSTVPLPRTPGKRLHNVPPPGASYGRGDGYMAKAKAWPGPNGPTPPEQRPAAAGNSGKGQTTKQAARPIAARNFRPTTEGLPWDPHNEAPISHRHCGHGPGPGQPGKRHPCGGPPGPAPRQKSQKNLLDNRAAVWYLWLVRANLSVSSHACCCPGQVASLAGTAYFPG